MCAPSDRDATKGAMDNLTHGLFGLAVGALRKPEGRHELSPTDKAVLLSCAVAAELPDLDYLWPAGDAVLRTLQAHRGPSHALVCAPLVAAIAMSVAKLVFRQARLAPVFGWSVLAVVFAHLLPDLWTGWGTRVFWPMSDARHAFDWTGVIDPLVTLPLLSGAVWGWRRRDRWRRAVLVGLFVSLGYIGLRVAIAQAITAQVAKAHPTASDVRVFPRVVGVFSWRYVATYPGKYVAGQASLFSGPQEARRVLAAPDGALPEGVAGVKSVDEAVQWARFPVVTHRPLGQGATRVEVADLRYHLHGEPTLRFVIEVNATGEVTHAAMERGGTARELLKRW